MDDFEPFYPIKVEGSFVEYDKGAKVKRKATVERMPKAGRGNGKRSTTEKVAASLYIFGADTMPAHRKQSIINWLLKIGEQIEDGSLVLGKRFIGRKDIRGDRVASVFIHEGQLFHKKGRAQIIAWLQHHAGSLYLHGRSYTSTFRARHYYAA